MSQKPTPLQLSGRSALKIIRGCADDSGRVFFTPHAEKRMRERKITRPQVLTTLRKGKITEGPAVDIKGRWSCVVEHFCCGELVTVVVGVERDDEGYVAIVTVY